MNEQLTDYGSDTCPRCGAPRSGESCLKCGVMYEKYDPEKELLKVPEQVRALWANVENNWTDTAAHVLFVEQGLRQDAAGFVAACYRQKGTDPVAVEQLDKLTARLIQTLALQAASESPVPKQSRRLIYVLLCAIIAILVFLIFAQSLR